jgi:hypothetical protein
MLLQSVRAGGIVEIRDRHFYLSIGIDKPKYLLYNINIIKMDSVTNERTN